MTKKDSFLQWKIRKGMFGWDHEYADLIDQAHDFGVNKGVDELEVVHQKLEQAEARVAEFEAWRKAFLESCNGCPKAWLLRKQAEAVDSARRNYNGNSRFPDGANSSFTDGFVAAETDFQDSLEEYAQRLRQQADEAEKEGGDRG